MRTFEDDDPLFAPMLNALFAAFRGTAVMSGCAPSATGADRVVTVTAGSVQIGGATVAVAGGTVTLDAGGETDRYDLVTVDATGALVATKGTGVRKCPTQPANTCLIAIVFVPAGATVIATGDVYDARMDAMRLSVLNMNVGSVYAGKVSAKIIPEIIASDELRASSPGSVTGPAAATYTKSKEITIGEVHGSENSVRVKFNALIYYNPISGSAFARVYVNGVAKSDELAITSSDFAPFSVDVTGIKTGDKVQLYLRGNGTQMGVVDGFNVCYDLVDVVLLPATTATL